MTQDADTRQITGKQVLFDAITLFKDTGAYIYELSKAVIVKIKSIIVSASDDNKSSEAND